MRNESILEYIRIDIHAHLFVLLITQQAEVMLRDE